MTLEDCAAIDHGFRAVPRRCLQGLRTAPGGSLQVRRPELLDDHTQRLLSEVERLFKTFVDRHGLSTALWTLGRMAGAEVLDRRVETLFGVLQSLQDMFAYG